MIARILHFDGYYNPQQMEHARSALQDLSAVTEAHCVSDGVQVSCGNRLPVEVLKDTAARAGCPVSSVENCKGNGF